ncbi:MAG TPA: competence protein CoiA family protein, partial [Pseudogracilibacillus sp.]|nr:competence protein CoiA family protein [Pseudogracilibacillus sp.]
MLQAKTKSGYFITLASLTKAEIAHKRNQAFFCPMCNEQVIVRAGPHTIPHFAHQSKSTCPHSGGGESNYHEKGKFRIFQWLKNQGHQVELEYYFPSIQQRPDVFLAISNKHIAIEYQCSRIPIQTIHKRTRAYDQLGITPLWILSAKLFKRLGNNRIKIDTFLRHFIHHFSTDTKPVLYFLCPNTNQILCFHHLYYNRVNQALGQITIMPLMAINFPELFSHQDYPMVKLYQDWKSEKRFFRIHRKNRLYGKERDWYNWLYEKRTHKEYVPSVIHVPVKGQHLMKTPPWDWQSRICLDIIHPCGIGDTLTYKECRHLLYRYIHQPDYFPLMKIYIDPIKEYLNILVKEGTLQYIHEGKYKKRKHFSFY